MDYLLLVPEVVFQNKETFHKVKYGEEGTNNKVGISDEFWSKVIVIQENKVENKQYNWENEMNQIFTIELLGITYD